MTTQEFEKTYWKYYLNLENDFLATEKYVAIDVDNKDAFSIEYMKILQMVCAEIDVVTKSFCKEIDASFKGDKINHYCKKITTEYTVFPKDSVRLLLCKIDLNPWAGWTFVDKVTKMGIIKLIVKIHCGGKITMKSNMTGRHLKTENKTTKKQIRTTL